MKRTLMGITKAARKAISEFFGTKRQALQKTVQVELFLVRAN
jgi:hypothetical protein